MRRFIFLLLIISPLFLFCKTSLIERSNRFHPFLVLENCVNSICRFDKMQSNFISGWKGSENNDFFGERRRNFNIEELIESDPGLYERVKIDIMNRLNFNPERKFNTFVNDPDFNGTFLNKSLYDLHRLFFDSLIINDYAAVYDFDKCNNFLFVDDASAFDTGDTVLLIQMKGVIIDSSNSSAFGDITSYNNVGNYEFNIVKSRSGSRIYLSNELIRDYDFKSGIVQLVRVPFYTNFSINKPLTALPWDGQKGGVLCFNASGIVNMGADIDVSGKGFIGGLGVNSGKVTMNESGFYYDMSSNKGGEKGEGVALISKEKKYGRGALANGGGGGNAHNAGGGGGGNGGKGGDGGDEYEPFKILAESIGGKGGKALANSSLINKLFLGGAGGMGQANDFAEFPAGNGGGIIIISANTLVNNSYSIKANGENAKEAPTPESSKDGMAGGGGGGSILLDIQHVINQVDIQIKGGKGADQPGFVYNGKYGPGGGGGGGIIAFPQATIPSQYQFDVSGGINGRNVNLGNDSWGAKKGEDGIIIQNFMTSVAINPFDSNISSVNIDEMISNCNQVDFKGDAVVRKNPINEWSWDFGNNTSSNLQNPIHNYLGEGIFSVKLVVSDINGCRDSSFKSITTFSSEITKTPDTSICYGSSVQLFVSSGNTFKWSPGIDIDNPDIAQPIVTPKSTTKYLVTVDKGVGCIVKDSVQIQVVSKDNFNVTEDRNICAGDSVILSASGGDQYEWWSSTPINNHRTIVVSPDTTTRFSVIISESQCGEKDTLYSTITVSPLPIIKAISSNDLTCAKPFSQLNIVGMGVDFIWSPDSSINNKYIANPIVNPISNTIYTVHVQDKNGCMGSDSLLVKVDFSDVPFYVLPNAFTPNGDGINDCYGLKQFKNSTELDFKIYNRWGELVFYTKNPDDCWDGTYKGKDQPTGTFIYVIRAKALCGDINKKGFITLIR